MLFPILITTAATPNDPSSVKLSSFEDRKKYVLDAVSHWQKISSATELVICDGSNYCFKEYLSSHSININKIEFLSFQNDCSAVQFYGKGFGESAIVKYALNNSVTLSKYSYFAKCTGKLWIKNFDKVINFYDKQPCVLMPYFSSGIFKTPRLEYIDTRFYIFNKNFYIKNFLNIYDEYSPGKSIEDLFLNKVLSLELKNVFFPFSLIVAGISGGSNTEYNTKKYRILKDSVRYFYWKRSPFFNYPFLSAETTHTNKK